MWTGTLALDLLLGDVHSLKEKRSVVRPVVAELRRRFAVSAAEAGHLDLHRRALVGVAVVAADRAHCVDVLAECERLVAGRPDIEVLSARARFLSSSDLDDHDDSGEEGSRAGADLDHGDRDRSAPWGTHPAVGSGGGLGHDPSHGISGSPEDAPTTGGFHG